MGAAGHLGYYYIDGMNSFQAVQHEYQGGPPHAALAIPTLPSYSYFDLNFRYEFSDNLTASLGIGNLFDKEAPMMATNKYADSPLSHADSQW